MCGGEGRGTATATTSKGGGGCGKGGATAWCCCQLTTTDYRKHSAKYCSNTVAKVNDTGRKRCWHQWVRWLASPLIDTRLLACRSKWQHSFSSNGELGGVLPILTIWTHVFPPPQNKCNFRVQICLKNANFDSPTTKDKIIFRKCSQKITNTLSTRHKRQVLFWAVVAWSPRFSWPCLVWTRKVWTRNFINFDR